jgi:N-glycosylase/DNA lyase
LRAGNHAQLVNALSGIHRFPFARSRYIVESRSFLQGNCSMRIRSKLLNFGDANERRDWLATEKGIKGLGYKEASHFLRNVGFRGYAILDKHVLQCMSELGLIDQPKPPATRKRYLEVEQCLKKFAKGIKINFDELDLVLWSLRTGEVLK